MELSGELVRVFFKGPDGMPSEHNYLDVQNATHIEIEEHVLEVFKATETCYYPMRAIAAFKVIEQPELQEATA